MDIARSTMHRCQYNGCSQLILDRLCRKNLLGLNIGSPDGRISENIPRNPTDFNHHTSSSSRRPPPQAANVGQQQQNGQPNGFGIPQVNSKGRFVHPQQPNTQSFAAQQQQQQQQNQQQSQQQSAARSQQQQQQKEQQMAGLVNNNGADAQEKIQR